MPSLSENDPDPPARSGPPRWLVAAAVTIVLVIIVLHLTGVVGPA